MFPCCWFLSKNWVENHFTALWNDLCCHQLTSCCDQFTSCFDRLTKRRVGLLWNDLQPKNWHIFWFRMAYFPSYYKSRSVAILKIRSCKIRSCKIWKIIKTLLKVLMKKTAHNPSLSHQEKNSLIDEKLLEMELLPVCVIF